MSSLCFQFSFAQVTTRGVLLTFPKYPTSGEDKASKSVSSPLSGNPLLLVCSIAAGCHLKNITISLEPLMAQEAAGKHTITQVMLFTDVHTQI